MIKKYVAKYEYHHSHLAEIEVEKETDKTVSRVGEVKDIIRSVYYLPARLAKSDYYIFDTKEDAFNWLILMAYDDIDKLNTEIGKIKEDVQTLYNLKREVVK